MGRNNFLRYFLLFLIIFILPADNLSFNRCELFGKNKSSVISKEDNSGIYNIKGGEGLAGKIKKSKKLRLTVHKVVEYLLKNNEDVKKILLEYKGLSSPLMEFRGKYDFRVYGNAGYGYSENPNKNTTTFYGTSTTRSDYGAGIIKSLNTGTKIKAGLSAFYQNIEGAGFPGINIGGKGYQTGIKVEIQQELLKNFMGYIDRLTEQRLANVEKIKKQLAKVKLAGLLVEALIGYWNVAIAEENLETSKINLNSTINIKNLIIRKLRLGLSEREDSLDWSSKVLQGRNNVDRAEKMLFDAKLAVYRILDIDSSIDIEIGKTFKTTPPEIKFEQALKDAFLKRIDWNNLMIALKNSELEYKIAYSNKLPSLTLNLSAGNKDYDEKTSGSFNNINKEYSVGIQLTYPLENRKADARLRNARLELQKFQVEKKSLEKLIRNDIASMVKDCEVNYKIYEQTKRSKIFSRNYYQQVYRKFKRGRYSALQLKLALDQFILSRQAELRSLINYNISLLKRDMARNVIFENLGIDIDGILKRIEN